MMNRSTLHKLILARRLYELSRENTSAVNDISLGIGINLLQDTVEMLLLAVSEHVNAGIRDNTKFNEYFDLINSKIAPKELPFRARLIALNKLRVNSKHYGLVPAKPDVDGLSITVREFIEEVFSSILGLSLANVSLVDLLNDGEVKSLLKDAESAFLRGDYKSCLINCRKSIFVRFESDYDVAPFKADSYPFTLGNKSPFFAHNKDYIEKNVAEPTDLIVLDHVALEMDLLKSGIDTVSFWNVWRSTPAVYREESGDEWVIKEDFRVFEEDGIRDRAEYVLDTTINLFVTAHQKLSLIRGPNFQKYYANLKKEQVPIYRKADLSSEVVAITPAGLTQVYVDYVTSALNGPGRFWHVVNFEANLRLWGYISEDDIQE